MVEVATSVPLQVPQMELGWRDADKGLEISEKLRRALKFVNHLNWFSMKFPPLKLLWHSLLKLAFFSPTPGVFHSHSIGLGIITLAGVTRRPRMELNVARVFFQFLHFVMDLNDLGCSFIHDWTRN